MISPESSPGVRFWIAGRLSVARNSFRLCLILAARYDESDETNERPIPVGGLVCDAGLVAAGVASSLKEKTGRFGTGTSAMVGRSCKLVGGLLSGVNRLPGRETAEEVYKPGVAVVTPADNATDSAL